MASTVILWSSLLDSFRDIAVLGLLQGLGAVLNLFCFDTLLSTL